MKKITASLFSLVVISTVFAQGFYVEYKMSSIDNGTTTDMGTMKMYAQGGNSRNESSMNIPGMGARTTVMLHLADSTNTIFLLDDAAKTYSTLNVQSSPDDADLKKEEYSVSVIGNETVSGYESTHVVISRKSDSKELMHMWLSTAVSDYADLSKIRSRYTGKGNMMAALADAGVTGFPVRIQTTERNHKIQIDFIKAEHKAIDNALLSLTGYSRSAGLQMNTGNLQYMTPEQRQQMMMEMMKNGTAPGAVPPGSHP